MNPLVSVVIPTYNRADLIIETLDSILGQSYKNLEVIVVSDGGTDNTPEVIDAINDNRLKFIRLEKNSGLPAVARNVGINMVKGEYIALCDDDDVWHKNKIEKQLQLFERYTYIKMVCSNALIFSDRKGVRYPARICIGFSKLSYKQLLSGNIVFNSSVLIKRNVLEQIGQFDEDPNLKAVEDYELWLRLLVKDDMSILYDPRLLLKYRILNDKISDRANIEIFRKIRLEKILVKHKLADGRKSIAVFNKEKFSLLKILFEFNPIKYVIRYIIILINRYFFKIQF